MKALYFLIPLFIVNSCKTQTDKVISTDRAPMEKTEIKRTGCPDEGSCEVVIHKNKKLEVINESGNSLYTELVEGSNLVIEYTYRRQGPEGTADGNYSEIIYFEIPSGTRNLKIENAELSQVKMIFAVLGFRNASYYQVTAGKLLFEKTDNTLSFDLKIDLGQVSHDISHIKESVSF